MAINLSGQAIKDVRVAGVQAQQVMLGTGSTAVEVWSAEPKVTITGTSGTVSRDQFRAGCAQYGVDYETVEVLPFLLDTSQATNLSYLFNDCYALTVVPDLDTSKATSMSQMFRGCSSLTAVPNFDTSNVTSISAMFYDCSSLTFVPDLDIPKVTNLSSLFYGCSALTTAPDLDTSKVTSMASMFYDCYALTSVPNFDTSKVTVMSNMFRGCSSLTAVPNFDTSNVVNMSNMFYMCSSLTTVPDLDTSQVTNMSNMFRDCSALTTAPNLDASQVTNMSYMFYGCPSLTHVPDLDTSQVTSMNYMLYGCSALTDGNVRLFGKHPSVTTVAMIAASGLTREPFYYTVTPVAPTFHDGEPWVTLPTQAGVTYSVEGTPGYSQTVTVTAAPQAGYELAGQTSWTHTYGPPPVSPAALGAVHWLPFTPEPTTDLGTQPRTWETLYTVTVTDGALASGVVRYPTNSAYTPIAGCAMTYWVKNTATLNALGAAPFKATATYSEMTQSINGQSRAVRWTFMRGATAAQNLYAGTVPRGEWTFIAACMEPVSGTTWRYRGYINGTQVVNSTYNAGTQHAVTWVSLQADTQDGHVDDTAVYNRALTAEEITALYGVGRTT